jgi:predicted  nucleic acid-binding Zn-ribbon protein
MSRAIASARQRRAGIEPAAAPTPSIASQQTSSPGGLTLPQVISLVDTRLIRLEQFMKETQENNNVYKPVVEFRDSSSNIISAESDPEQLTDLNEILEEYNNRFVLLAEEIGQLKDIVMKLQTYTMDVNKMLLEERVNVLSDIGNNSMYVMNTTTLSVEDVQNVEESVVVNETETA